MWRSFYHYLFLISPSSVSREDFDCGICWVSSLILLYILITNVAARVVYPNYSDISTRLYMSNAKSKYCKVLVRAVARNSISLTFAQYFLLIHINATVFGTGSPLFGAKSKSYYHIYKVLFGNR